MYGLFSTRFSRKRALQGHRPGFGPRVARGAGHWLQATPILPFLRFPAPLFVTALRLRLGLPHPCLATYAACSCGHPLDPLGTHLLRCARGGERTSSHDSVRDAVYHIIREYLPSSAPRGRRGRVHIVISDAEVGHTLVNIVVADPTSRDLVERAARHDLVAATDAERRKEAHYRDRIAWTKCVPFALETFGALSDRSDFFWSSVPLYHLESPQARGPPLACRAHGSVRECRLHCNGR